MSCHLPSGTTKADEVQCYKSHKYKVGLSYVLMWVTGARVVQK